jgi:hypothetical protein
MLFEEVLINIFNFISTTSWYNILNTSKTFCRIGRLVFDPNINDHKFIFRQLNIKNKNNYESLKYLIDNSFITFSEETTKKYLNLNYGRTSNYDFNTDEFYAGCSIDIDLELCLIFHIFFNNKCYNKQEEYIILLVNYKYLTPNLKMWNSLVYSINKEQFKIAKILYESNKFENHKYIELDSYHEWCEKFKKYLKNDNTSDNKMDEKPVMLLSRGMFEFELSYYI